MGHPKHAKAQTLDHGRRNQVRASAMGLDCPLESERVLTPALRVFSFIALEMRIIFACITPQVLVGADLSSSGIYLPIFEVRVFYAIVPCL
jgi:hypothetical protein